MSEKLTVNEFFALFGVPDAGDLPGGAHAQLVCGDHLAPDAQAGWQSAYVNHIYFSYISLWDGFTREIPSATIDNEPNIGVSV